MYFFEDLFALVGRPLREHVGMCTVVAHVHADWSLHHVSFELSYVFVFLSQQSLI